MNADFEELYERFFHDVYLFILAASGDPYIAEEITQETFFRALKEIRHFKGNCSVKSWLCQIAKNLYISQKRKKACPFHRGYPYNGHIYGTKRGRSLYTKSTGSFPLQNPSLSG